MLSGISEREACEKMGKTASYFKARTRGSVPQVDNAAMIMEAFGWKIVAVPADKVPDGAVPITSDGTEGGDADNRRQIAAMQRKLELLQRQSEELQKRIGDLGE